MIKHTTLDTNILKEKEFQSIRTLLDDKILHYEGLAFKEQPTKEEYLTIKKGATWIACFCKRTRKFGKRITSRCRLSPFHTLQI